MKPKRQTAPRPQTKPLRDIPFMPNTPHHTQTRALLLTALLLLVALASTACSNDLEVTELALDIEANNDDNNDDNNDPNNDNNNDTNNAPNNTPNNDDNNDIPPPECVAVEDCDSPDLPGTIVDCMEGTCMVQCGEGFIDADEDLGTPDSDGCECQPTQDPTEICDGKDNDCDNVVDDEDDDYVASDPSPCMGVCSEAPVACVIETDEVFGEVCDYDAVVDPNFIGLDNFELDFDDKDNNCDGRVDDLSCVNAEDALIRVPFDEEEAERLSQISTAIAISQPENEDPNDAVLAIAWLNTPNITRSPHRDSQLRIAFFNLLEKTTISGPHIVDIRGDSPREPRLVWDGDGFSLAWIANDAENVQKIFLRRYNIQGEEIDLNTQDPDNTHKIIHFASEIKYLSVVPLAQDSSQQGRSLLGWLATCPTSPGDLCTNVQRSDQDLGLVRSAQALGVRAVQFGLTYTGQDVVWVWRATGTDTSIKAVITAPTQSIDSRAVQNTINTGLSDVSRNLLITRTGNHFALSYTQTTEEVRQIIRHIDPSGEITNTTHAQTINSAEDMALLGLEDRAVLVFQPAGSQRINLIESRVNTENPTTTLNFFEFAGDEDFGKNQDLSVTRGPNQTWAMGHSLKLDDFNTARAHAALITADNDGQDKALCLQCHEPNSENDDCAALSDQ